jgi:threonyl-tRNA synthetase
VRIIPISDKFTEAATRIAEEMETHNLRVDIDDRSVTMQRKVREAEMEWIDYIIVFGQKEMDSGTLAVRERRLKKITPMRSQQLIDEITKETSEKPYRSLTLPRELSKHPRF